MANLFKIGDKFETYDEFNTFFQKWCTENFHSVCVYDSHTITDVAFKSTVQFKDMHISCVHSGVWTKPSTGKREKRSLKIGCSFRIKLAFGKNPNFLEIKQRILSTEKRRHFLKPP